MKNKIINSLFALLVLGFVSCGEESNMSPYYEIVSETAAKVKFEHVAIGPAGTNFAVNWFINDSKTSGALTTTGLPLGIAYGGQYPASINYALVPAGNNTMKVEIPATATVPAATVISKPLVVESGKNYTTFLVGTSPNYSDFTVNDDLTVTDPTKAYIRFLNFISNTPTGGYDFSIKELNSNAVVYSGVGYLTGNKAFIPITVVGDLEATTYEFQMRAAGTATVIAKAAFTPRKGRVYTFYSYGYVGGLPATKNLPTLTYYTNK